ncbi:MAG: glutathione gamma-glutamylcysteinyltransferase [Symploca sp. SIO1A3]|nr:glutathione gamma-glutamylcysteinyltransferase [Symploca sp. SIO1A3]
MNTKNHRLSALKLICFPILTLLLGLCFAGELRAQTLPLAENLINLNSSEGEELLMASQARQDYLPLSIQFVTQKNSTYCGVASMVMVLNALSVPAPETPEFGQYNTFTQDNLFNAKATEVTNPEVVAHRGMTLAELGKILESYPVKAEVYYGGQVTLAEFRNLLVNNLQESNNFVLVNYLRKTIRQETGGHISPVAAYNEETDRFLILDVSRYKYPPVWVKAEELWQAIATIDSTSGKTRGFVLVSLGGDNTFEK